MKKTGKIPHIVGGAVALPYCLLLFLATLPVLTGPAGSMEAFWAVVLSMPWILMMDTESMELVPLVAISGLINAAILYLMGWGIAKLIVIAARGRSPVEK